MIVRVVRLTLKSSSVQSFDELFNEHCAAIESQPGCLGVELLHDAHDSNVRATLSRWASEAHLNAYRGSALFGKIWPLTKVMFSASPEVWSYEVQESS